MFLLGFPGVGYSLRVMLFQPSLDPVETVLKTVVGVSVTGYIIVLTNLFLACPHATVIA
jgi:hypothetical protein